MGRGGQEEKIRQRWGGWRWFVDCPLWELLLAQTSVFVVQCLDAAPRQEVSKGWCKKMPLLGGRWVVVVESLVAVQGGVLGVEGSEGMYSVLV